MSGNSRWIFIGALIGAMLLSVGGIIFSRHAQKEGDRFDFPTFIKARTNGLAMPGSGEPPAPIVVQLSADMVRVSAIALGHPRLAVINGKTVTEGDSITLQVPNATLALILRVAKIGDGSIDHSFAGETQDALIIDLNRPQDRFVSFQSIRVPVENWLL